MEDAGGAAHLVPTAGRLLGRVRLAVDPAADLEHRVAADHDAVELSDRRELVGDRRRLRPGEQQHQFGRRKVGAPLGCGGCGHSILVDVRRLRERLDPGLSQKQQSGGRGGGEADAHVHHRILEG